MFDTHAVARVTDRRRLHGTAKHRAAGVPGRLTPAPVAAAAAAQVRKIPGRGASRSTGGSRMRRLLLAVVTVVLCSLPVAAQEPPAPPASASAETPAAAGCNAWTDDPIVPGVTPLRAAHIMELRACIDFLLARGGSDPDPDPAACEGWQRRGQGEFVIEVPACLNRVHLRVDPVSGTVSDFGFWVRAQGEEWARLAAGRVSVIDCQLGLACHFEGTYAWRSGAELGVTVELGLTVVGGTVDWALTRRTQ